MWATKRAASSPSGDDLRAELTMHFKPEFINRLDDIVRFASPTRWMDK